MAERSKAHAWKVCIGHKPIVGSNPTLSASTLRLARDQTVVLVCQWKRFDGSPLPELTLTIDYQKSTVNGKPAAISESEIVMGNSTRLNRHTGGMAMIGQDMTALASGTCARAVERKF
jgi:hypothetical protein